MTRNAAVAPTFLVQPQNTGGRTTRAQASVTPLRGWTGDQDDRLLAWVASQRAATDNGNVDWEVAARHFRGCFQDQDVTAQGLRQRYAAIMTLYSESRDSEGFGGQQSGKDGVQLESPKSFADNPEAGLVLWRYLVDNLWLTPTDYNCLFRSSFSCGNILSNSLAESANKRLRLVFPMTAHFSGRKPSKGPLSEDVVHLLKIAAGDYTDLLECQREDMVKLELYRSKFMNERLRPNVPFFQEMCRRLKVTPFLFQELVLSFWHYYECHGGRDPIVMASKQRVGDFSVRTWDGGHEHIVHLRTGTCSPVDCTCATFRYRRILCRHMFAVVKKENLTARQFCKLVASTDWFPVRGAAFDGSGGTGKPRSTNGPGCGGQ